MLTLTYSPIKSMEALVQATPGCISFAQGALKVGGVPDQIRAHARELLLTDKADYYQSPLGIIALREKIAAWLNRQYTISLQPEQVLISHGSMGALASLCLTVLERDDEVIIPEPSYPVYANISRCAKAKPIPKDIYKKSIEPNGLLTWQLDLDLLKQEITQRTKMIILSNPSNPLGISLSKHELMSLVELALEHKIYLVLDEVYDLFIYNSDFHSLIPFVTQSPYLIRLGSFSKNFAMSGWRVGYLIGDSQLIKTMSSIQDVLICCPTVISQYAALYALDHPKLMDPARDKVQQSKLLALNTLQKLADCGYIHYAKPAGGYYLFIETPHQNGEQLAYDIFEKTSVGLVPGNAFGQNYTNFLRLCFAREPELVYEGVKRLISYFEQYHTPTYTTTTRFQRALSL